MNKTQTDYAFDTKLILMIKENPCLYDIRLRALNFSGDEIAWRLIAHELKVDVSQCIKRWKQIRSRYAKYIKSTIKSTRRNKHTSYSLAQNLEFLKPYIFVKKGYKDEDLASSDNNNESSDEQGDDNDDYYDTDRDDHNDKVVKKRKFDSSESSPQQALFPSPSISPVYLDVSCSNSPSLPGSISSSSGSLIDEKYRSEDGLSFNADLAFMKSLIPDIQKMTSKQKNTFQIEVRQLCQRILNEG